MNAIFFKDNVYIAVFNKEDEEFDMIQEDPSLVGCFGGDEAEKYLYGNRVKLELDCTDYACLYIDGIPIHVLDRDDKSFVLDDMMSIETCVAFLNQIEHLGVDTFLSNYKKSLEKLKQDLETQTKQLSQEISVKGNAAKESLLAKMEFLLHSIICMLFVLSINMNAGLENQIYIETSEKIVQHFFND